MRRTLKLNNAFKKHLNLEHGPIKNPEVKDLIFYQVFEKYPLSPLIQSVNYPVRPLFIRSDSRMGWKELGKPQGSNYIASPAFEHTKEL